MCVSPREVVIPTADADPWRSPHACAGRPAGENQCNDTDGGQLVAASSVGRAFLAPGFLRPYTAGIWGRFRGWCAVAARK